jgi:pimeloyl-ACP methyl ester carboxylesterase
MLVLLPGIGGVADDFALQGLVSRARTAGIRADLIAVDAHYGYYASNLLRQRLKADVIDLARRRGHDCVWLAGISLGGLGALLYAERHPRDICGVLLIAPYLGEAGLAAEIRAAGGLTRWRTDGSSRDFRRVAWARLQAAGRSPGRLPPIYLAYAESDRYAPGQALLAEQLPAAQVIRLPGGHDWPTWRRLWDALLPRTPLLPD